VSIKLREDVDFGKPYWWEHGADLPELPTSLPGKSELLIIGAGYTGLSAAIAASDAGAKVTVVDSDVPGQGASTRNGGMFGAHPRFSFSILSNKFGLDTAKGIFNEAQEAFDFTSGLIQKENIDCHFDQCGRIQLAWTKAHFESQKKQVDAIQSSTNMNLELVSRDEMMADINTDRYFGGIRFPDHASLQPRQFHDGLMAAVLSRNITVVQHCSIEQVEKQAAGFRAISTSGDSMVAEKVLMATNGYTQGQFGWFKRRVFPLPSFLIATEALSKNLLDTIAPGRRMMVETRARHSYFRVSPDGTRIIYGGRAAMRPIPIDQAAYRLRQTLGEVWPELENVKLSHCWFGNTGYTFTHMPQVGTHDGVHYSMGYSGSGVAIAPYLGAKAAYLALGDERGKTAYQATNLEPRWFHPTGKPMFLYPANTWFNKVVDKVQNIQASGDKNAE